MWRSHPQLRRGQWLWVLLVVPMAALGAPEAAGDTDPPPLEDATPEEAPGGQPAPVEAPPTADDGDHGGEAPPTAPGHEKGHEEPAHDPPHEEPDHGTPHEEPDHGTPHEEPDHGTPHEEPDHGTPHTEPEHGTAPGEDAPRRPARRVRVVPVPVPLDPFTGPTDVPGPPLVPGFLPDIPQRGWSKALALVLAAAGALVLASVARRSREGLREGLLRSLFAALETLARGTMAFVGVSLVAQLVPRGLLPVLPWAILAAALAVGWSLREALLDIVAWIQLSSEGNLVRGRWVSTAHGQGRIVRLGLRATWLDDGYGRHIAVPNRRLTGEAVSTDQARWPRVEVELQLTGMSDEVARDAISEAVLMCPWVAPSPDLSVAGDPHGAGVWTVQVRLLEGRFREVLEGTLRERVLDQVDRAAQ